MVVETLPFVVPHVGRMSVNEGPAGVLNVVFAYANGHGAMVGRGMGESMFRLTALDSAGNVATLPEILGEGVVTAQYLTEYEVTALLTRIATLR